MTFGTLTLPDYYTEFKRQQEEAMEYFQRLSMK